MGRSFQATPEVLSRLKLISPLRKGADAEEKGTLVAFKDKDGNELGAIIIGKQHGSREKQTAMGGQYVRLAGQDTVYLVDKYVAYELFDGTRYKIYPGMSKSNGKEGYYLKIAVDYVPTPKKTPINDSKDEKKETKAQKAESEVSTKELEFKARQLNDRLSPWVFAVSRWNAQAFATDPQELMEKKSEKKSTTQKDRPNKKKG